MTKAEIVQRLLDEKQITAKEAVVLLKETSDTNYPYIPNVNPYFPEGPNRTTPPPVWSSTNTWEYPDTKFTPPTEK